MTIGDNIRKIRKEKGLTQKQLGELCGIHEVQIRSYELNRGVPKIKTLQKISNALNVPLSKLDESLQDDNENIDENVGDFFSQYYDDDFHIKLKELRKKKKMSRKELGIRSGIEEKRIESFENNTGIIPKMDEMINISNALDVDVFYFYQDIVEYLDSTGYRISGKIDNIYKFEIQSITEFEKIQAEYKRALRAFEFSEREKYLLQTYKLLNETGKRIAVERVEELTFIEKYTVPDNNKED